MSGVIYQDPSVRVAMDKTVVFMHEGSIRLVLSRAQMREIVRGWQREIEQEVHNCEDCGSGWQRDHAGAHWGRCHALGMRTPARGAGCRNSWTPKRESHGCD